MYRVCVCVCFMAGGRYAREDKPRNTCKASAHVTFTHIPLTKASPMAKPQNSGVRISVHSETMAGAKKKGRIVTILSSTLLLLLFLLFKKFPYIRVLFLNFNSVSMVYLPVPAIEAYVFIIITL